MSCHTRGKILFGKYWNIAQPDNRETQLQKSRVKKKKEKIKRKEKKREPAFLRHNPTSFTSETQKEHTLKVKQRAHMPTFTPSAWCYWTQSHHKTSTWIQRSWRCRTLALFLLLQPPIWRRLRKIWIRRSESPTPLLSRVRAGLSPSMTNFSKHSSCKFEKFISPFFKFEFRDFLLFEARVMEWRWNVGCGVEFYGFGWIVSRVYWGILGF